MVHYKFSILCFIVYICEDGTQQTSLHSGHHIRKNHVQLSRSLQTRQLMMQHQLHRNCRHCRKKTIKM